MKTYIAILRGINVGGKRMIKMLALKQLFTDLGFLKIETHIHSGNVIFQTKNTKEQKLATIIANEINKVFTFDVPTIVINIDDLKQIIINNPFVNDIKKSTEYLHVTFLATAPTDSNIESINKLNFGEDEFVINPKAIYLYCPNSYSKSKLTNTFFENKLKVMASTRNLKTCNELLSIAEKY